MVEAASDSDTVPCLPPKAINRLHFNLTQKKVPAESSGTAFGALVKPEDVLPENEIFAQNKVNTASLQNAFCNDNNIVKVHQLTRAKPDQSEVTPTVCSISSPFEAKTKSDDFIGHGDKEKLLSVANPANLYIHGALKKNLVKDISVNFHEAQG